MGLDPMKRRLVTRILAALDTITGLCVFIIQIHRMWEYYYPFVIKNQNAKGKSKEIEVDDHTPAAMTAFILISTLVLTTKVLQIVMGFGLLVATFGRNCEESIRISRCWLRTSVFILITQIFKLFFMISGFVLILAKLLGNSPFEVGLTVFGLIFRLFSAYWVTRFIIFLQWQAEFESYCSHH